MESVETWTYTDFLTYLLILGAQADLRVTDEEKEQIIHRVGKENYTRIRRIFDRQNDSQHIDTVSDLYKKYGSQLGGKENLVKEIRDIVIVGKEGKEHIMDRYLQMMLKKIL